MQELYPDELAHIGVGPDDNPPGRGSGRYPKGSGENPFQHDEFYMKIRQLERNGLTEKEIADEFKMTVTNYRALKRVATADERKAMAVYAKELASRVDENGKKLYSNAEIGQMIGGVGESQVRNLLKEDYTGNTNKLRNTMDALKELCTDENYVDIGVGSCYALGCSNTQLDQAARVLQEKEGYIIREVKVDQLGTGMKTTLKVLVPPGTDYQEVFDHRERINPPGGSVEEYPVDANGMKKNSYNLHPPVSIDSSRVMVRYAEDGGIEKGDGTIQLRRGVDDISLGNASYAQVRIGVDDKYYLKGMALYGQDEEFPPGIDVIFNTNKHRGTPMVGEGKIVLKEMKDDPDNPFGALIDKQLTYFDKDGNKKLSAINIVNEEGDWGGGIDEFGNPKKGWAASVSAQMLSKQPEPLIKKQLNLTYADKVSEYDDIMSVDNPVVKSKLLESFADGCDTAAVKLKSAPFPRQSWNVILPVSSLKDDEIFAPQYENGETVVLIRYPHGGTFEIPQLKVNNNNKEARSSIGVGSIDAVGINAKVAERLSGADFDGDTVLVIPANSNKTSTKIQISPALEGLKDFDPKERYPKREGMKVMKEEAKQLEMGKISNLITDMTIKGADSDELAAAVRHSMVVIDAVKHKLDYEQSYIDNNIEELKKKYQPKPDGSYGGASTLISKAKSVEYVNAYKEGKYLPDPETGKMRKYYADPVTGKKLRTETGELKRKLVTEKKLITDDNGNQLLDDKGKKQYEEVPVLNEKGKKQWVQTDKKVLTKSTKMAETDDAYTLSSGYKVENLYADYANKVKGLANEARKAQMAIRPLKRDPLAAKEYADEVKSLSEKLLIAKKNAPRERQAQLLANLKYDCKLKENPGMTKEQKKKVKGQCLAGARNTVGAKKAIIGKDLPITDREWEAVKKGAISNNMLKEIVDNADLDTLKRLSMPRSTSTQLSQAKISKIKHMINSGYTIQEVAQNMNLSTSTVGKYS